MEPPKPQLLQFFAKQGLRAEYEEYERLLSQRFERDPSLEVATARSDAAARDRRLRELGEILEEARTVKPVR